MRAGDRDFLLKDKVLLNCQRLAMLRIKDKVDKMT